MGGVFGKGGAKTIFYGGRVWIGYEQKVFSRSRSQKGKFPLQKKEDVRVSLGVGPQNESSTLLQGSLWTRTL